MQDQSRELRQIQNWLNQNGRNNRKRWGSPSYGCGDAGDSVVWDVERQLQPKCWITRNQQLASPGRGLGLTINAVSYSVFGTNTWTHFVPTFRPCGSHGAPQDDLNADPYYGDDQLKPLSTSWRIDDLQDQPEIGPACFWK
jgi:hypothetical protein